MKFFSGLLAGVLLTIAWPASAQSLGDVAKKEQERRKATPPAAKTYTNDDLKKLPPAPGSTTDPAVKLGDQKDAAKANAKDATAAEGAKAGGLLARPRHRGARGNPPQRDVPRRAAGAHQRPDRRLHRP
jgi:hypothetical protein